jgi:outer membrane protein assembly factor BamB
VGTRSIRTAVAVGLASVLSSGCWPQPGFDAGHTRYNWIEDGLTADDVATLTEDWSVSLLGPPREPIVQGGRVFVVAGDATLPTTDVEVYALDLATGATDWTTSLVSLPVHASFFTFGPVTLAAEQLWTSYAAVDFTTGSGRVASGVRLDPATGTLLGSGTSDAIPHSSPILDTGDHVVELVATPVTSPTATLRVRDPATAAIEWVATFPGLVPSAPVAVEGQVFVAVETTLHAFAPAGCGAPTCPPTWSVPIAAPAPKLVASGDTLVAVVGSDLLSIDRATGQVRWQAALGSTGSGAAVTTDTVYVATGSSVLAFDAEGCGQPTCAPTWSGSLGTAAAGAPVVAGGAVYVGAGSSLSVFAADGCGSASCSPLVTLPLGAPVSSLSVAQGRLLVANGTSVTSFGPR